MRKHEKFVFFFGKETGMPALEQSETRSRKNLSCSKIAHVNGMWKKIWQDAEAAVSSTCHASMCFLFGIGTMCVVWCEGIRQSEFAYGKAHDHIANTCQAMTQE